MRNIYNVIVILISISVYSQETPGYEIPNFAAKSPEAAAFLRYGEYPVELSTGVPGISIPLYTIDIGDYKLPITLDYHASGIKVNQEATWTGLGWNLNYGAQVILSVRDDIDENNQVVDSIPNANTLINYWSNHPYGFNASVLVNEQLEKSRVKDVYNFSSPTANGSFYIRNFAINDVVIFPPDASFKVTLLGASRENMGFKITDSKGNEYLFDNTKEISARTQTHSDYYISAWFVDQIKTGSNNIIRFNYQDDGTINDYSFSERIDVKDNCLNCGCIGTANVVHVNSLSEVKIDHGSTMTNAKKISQILFNNDNSRIVFEKTNGRLDLEGANGYLSKIKIENLENGQYTLKKGFVLNYTYFVSNDNVSNLEYKKKKLKLESVNDLINNIDIIGHNFVYSDIELPNKMSKSQDYFGYYNGAFNIDMIPKHFITFPFNTEVGHGDRKVNPNLNQAGILKEIHYPTKGWTKFNYENNQYYGVDELDKYNLQIVSSNVLEGNIGSGDYNPLNSYVHPIDITPGCNSSDPTRCVAYREVPFSATNANGILTFKIINDGTSTTHYQYARVRVYNSSGVEIYNSGEIKTTIPTPTTYSFTEWNSGVILLECYGQIMSIKDLQVIYTNNDNSEKNLLGGGLRIKQIENYNHDNQKISEKLYNYTDVDNSNKSSGKLINNLSFSYLSKPSKNFNFGICIPTESQPGGGNHTYPKVDYTKIYSYSSNSNYGIEGNTVIYQNVIERQINTDGIDNGYTVFKFTTESDLIPYGENSVFINRPWLRGKVLEKSIYKKLQNNNIYKCIYKENNEYIDDTAVVSIINGFKLWVNARVTGVLENYDPFQLPFQLTGLLGEFGIPDNTLAAYEFTTFNLPIYRNYLKSTKVEEYFYDNSTTLTGTITNKKTYTYDNPAHLQLSSQLSESSAGEEVETLYYYPQDTEMLYEPHFGELIAKNMIGIPLKTVIRRNNDILSVQKTIYNNWGNNLLLPQTIQTSKGSNALEDRVKYNVYDSYGNPLELQKENGVPICYIWGYHHTQPVAKIENIRYAEIPPNLITAIQSATDDLNSTESGVLGALGALRNDASLGKAMITTYTYIPLVGVSIITDPRGNKTTYEYDTFNRLKAIRDYEGNILSENEYHYRTQN